MKPWEPGPVLFENKVRGEAAPKHRRVRNRSSPAPFTRAKVATSRLIVTDLLDGDIGDSAPVRKHTISPDIGWRTPKITNVAAPGKQSLLSHAIFAINIPERLNMFWRKARAQ